MRRTALIVLISCCAICLLTGLAIKFVLPPDISEQDAYDLATAEIRTELGNPSVLEISSLEDSILFPRAFGILVIGTIKTNASKLQSMTDESANGTLDFMVGLDAERWKTGKRNYFAVSVDFSVPENKSK